jgi:predicted aminopeptidase
VQREGLRQWRRSRGLAPDEDAQAAQDDAVARLVVDLRERLRRLYASALPPAAMRERKSEEIEALRRDYRQQRDAQWHGKSDYDEWMDTAINNAKLLPFGLYNRRVPAFAALFARHGDDWPAFYAAVRQLARLAPAARAQALQELQRQ